MAFRNFNGDFVSALACLGCINVTRESLVQVPIMDNFSFMKALSNSRNRSGSLSPVSSSDIALDSQMGDAMAI